jgi:mannose-6-phosphate isomerase-like protein (cupin superfamily)
MNINKEQFILNKGWGYELWITNTEKYCGKLLFFREGKKCSWHYHKKKDEVFYLQSGKVEVIYGFEDTKFSANKIILNKGDSFHVPVGLRHQMYALKESELFEFST